MAFCVICINGKRAKSGRAKENKLCVKCYMRIIKGYEIYQPTGALHSKCVICGRDINHSNTHPICRYGACRGLFYRRIEDIKKLNKAIETDDYSNIQGFDVKKINKLGFDIKISKN